MKAVLFCRVSSKEQEVEGYSLPAQEKLLRGHAERLSLEVIRVFSISESAGGKSQRKIFNEMMGFVKKNGIKIIICEKVDRLTRNFKDAVVIDDWLEGDEERQVHLVKDSLTLHKNSRSQEKLNWGIRILFAKNHIDNLSEEVKKGQKEKIAQGWFPSHPKLGYKTVGEKGHKIHVLDEEKAPMVKRAFELYASGNYSLSKLVALLNGEGLRMASGSKLVKSRLHGLLSDPFYHGWILWNGELHKGEHQTLITKELFDKVQRLLKGRATPKYGKHNHLFRGLIRCSGCGGSITWEVHSGIVYGHCNHYHNCGQTTWSKEKDVEYQILPVLAALKLKSPRVAEWVRKALKESHKDEVEYNTASITALNVQLSRLEKRLEGLYEDKLDGKITGEFYERKSKEYKADKDDVVEQIKKHTQAGSRHRELGVNFYDLSQKGEQVYLKLKDKPEKKRGLLKMVFSRMVLDEGRLITTYSKAFQLLFEAVQATNSSKVENLPPAGLENFEQAELAVIKGKSGVFDPARSRWLRIVDDVRTIIRRQNEYVYIPDLSRIS